MYSCKIIFASILFLVALTISVKAQNDSVSVEVHEERFERKRHRMKFDLTYFKRSMKDEKELLKFYFAIPNVGFSFRKNSFNMTKSFAGGVGYESKISPAFSLTAGLDNYLNVTFDFQDVIRDKFDWIHLSFYGGIRYYPTILRNMRTGEGGNNLLSHYIEVSVPSLIYYNPGIRPKVAPNIVIALGTQHRFAKYGYMDFRVGAIFSENGVIPLWFRLNLGLAFSMKKEKPASNQ